MADQKHWWKMHSSILTDDKILSLPPADRWAWVALATHTREHGESGHLEIDRESAFLALIFGVPKEQVFPTLKRLPNVVVEETAKCNSKISLHYKNWNKYAEDNSLERVRKHREEKKCNATEERRREEKRGEKKRITPPPPPASDVFEKDSWAKEPWPSVRLFVALYNAEAPDEWPAVERVSEDTRAKKIREYLTKFPTPEFWTTVFRQAKASRFLRNYKNGGLDWLLQRGQKDGVENCVKCFEGKYAD